MRRTHVPALVAAAAFGSLLLASSTASAEGGTVSPQYQGYSSTSGGQDPYASSNPQDVHVDGYGGQPVVTGYVLLNLDSLPQGSNIDGLTLSLTPNTSQTDNVNAGAAVIDACLLTQPLASNGYQATPLTYDCSLPHAAGEPQPNGDWHFDVTPLAQYWQKNTNDGLALVASDPPVQAGVTVSPAAWSVGFDHTKTTGMVDYSGGSSASVFGPTTSSGGGSQAFPSIAPAPAVVAPAPLPSATTPSPAPTSTPRPNPSATPATSGGATAQPPAGPAGPHVSQQWVWLTVALAGTALLMLLIGAGQQVLRTGRVSLTAFGAALSRSRSQLATPVATLALASVFALGFSGQASALGSSGGGALGGGSSGATAGTSTGAGPGAISPGATPTGSAATQPGASPGSSAAAPGTAANGNTNGGNNGPGVTATTVRIGFTYQTNSQAANQAFGFQVASTGNQQSEEQALVDYVNKHGGIGGRQVVPVYVPYDVAQAESDPNVNTEICHSLTEDYHVFAVVAGGGTPDGDSCYAQRATLDFDVAYTAPDLAFLQSTSPYIWATEAASLDRGMRWEMAGLTSRKFFSGVGPSNVGVIVAKDNVNDNVYNQVTLPALQAAGISQPLKFDVPYDTTSDLANTMKQAVVQFQAKGITNVIFQGGGSGGGGSYAILFMVDAESQHYNPRYGLGSSDAPVALAGNVPEDQLSGALAVGELGSTDTDDQHYLPWPSTPNEKLCASIEAAAGNTATSREGALAFLAYCNGMFELQQGAQGLTTLNAQLWADHVMQLGSSVFNDSVYSAVVGPRHWDAAGGYRLLHAVLNCEGSKACFVYDNSTVYGG